MKVFKIQNFSFINLIGLTVGITSVLAIMLWVEDELTFDAFHKDSDAIYRVLVEENGMNDYTNSAMTMPPVAKVLQENIPEVEKATSYEANWNVVVKAGDNYLNEDGMAVVAPNFFDVFSFPVIKGNPHRLDNEKFTVAISQKTAKKYFGNEEPLGKSIEINKTPVTVVAIFEDITYNSHITFDLLIPIALSRTMFGRDEKNDWGRQVLYTYIKIKPNITQQQLTSKLNKVLANSPGKDKVLLAQPLKDIHFQKNLADEDYTNVGNKSYVSIFSFLGLFILILACVNYINLSTATSEKEILNNGIRKLFGADKSRLIKSSLIKYITISTVATLFSLLVLFLMVPFINQFAGKTINLNPFTPIHILFIVLVSIITGVLSGLYPAISMSSFSPIKVIKKSAHSGGTLRQWLTVFQFSISVFLIAATIVSFKQFNHIRNANTGFDKEHVLYFRLDHKGENYLSLKGKLLKIPHIEKVGGNMSYSATILNTVSVKLPKQETGNTIFAYNMIDEDFFPLLKVKMLDGQNFSEESKSQWGSSVIINKKALDLFDGNPIGQSISFSGNGYTITGIIDETHFRSINSSLQPELYVFEPRPNYVFVRYMNGTNIGQLTNQIASVVKEIYPEAPLGIQFLDATYDKLYENDKRFGSLFAVMAVIAIIISSIGLFALTRFATEKRFKEIGIRKINGANISEVMIMLNKDFVKWVAIAFVIATPIAYYAMNKWLESFAYKTELSWWIFALAGALALGIALLTVSWQSWRAATRNPVEALRYE